VHPDPATGAPVVDFTNVNTTVSTRLADARRCSLCGNEIGYWAKRAELHSMQQTIRSCLSRARQDCTVRT
jgi:hypothetical protein